ncbi:hypothetical protein FPSE_09476 [Fusarium pseudograminearum CS3096]|uniref:Mid2 domain-containing protein n=1 Tax=Fusarium pseudograminearum (strain CS3096) TaxID=1028729 RepID=K3VA01_FUSPC|nr:hypothetical protein FPSE_09476 [Fusarium pseudograminearum CS3096]EKJ70259.1 hypothetical protein FPSE_09476 [Fusarium pseudograminearum CS3096]
MEIQQGSSLDGSPTSSPQHKKKARSFVDATGNLFSSVPPGWTPIDTVPGWATVYTESGKPVTASRNQLTIIGEIPTTTVTEQAPPPSGSSRSGWSWVTESSTYTIDITWASTLTENPTTTSESTTHSSVTVPWWSKTYTESIQIPTATETTFISTTSSTESSTESITASSTTSSTSSTSSSTTWPSSTATSAPETSPTNVQWISLTISLFTCLVMIAMVIFVFVYVYRRRSEAPPRERENRNENNINVNVESGRFRNRPLAETNPGCVPQGWDDIRL